MRSGSVCGTVANGARGVRGGGRVARLCRVVAVAALSVALPLSAAVSAPPALAKYNAGGFDFWVDSSMGPIKSRIFRAADGNTKRVVYALDGLRARNDLSGWENDTDISRVLPRWNINVVMPVGGMSSFYCDWIAPSNTNGQRVTYAWETFLTRDLRRALHDRLHFNPTGNGIFGLSMGGGSALMLAAYHPDQFRYAASYSGYLDTLGPGMPAGLRAAMLDAGGFNIDAMWGPPGGERWQRDNPAEFASLLHAHGTRLWISTGNGSPGPHDAVASAEDAYHLTNSEVLEAISLSNTRSFQARWNGFGPGNAVFDYLPAGVHNWPYWTDEVYKMLPDMNVNIG